MSAGSGGGGEEHAVAREAFHIDAVHGDGKLDHTRPHILEEKFIEGEETKLVFPRLDTRFNQENFFSGVGFFLIRVQECVEISCIDLLKKSEMSGVDADKRDLTESGLVDGFDKCAVAADGEIEIALGREIARGDVTATFKFAREFVFYLLRIGVAIGKYGKLFHEAFLSVIYYQVLYRT